MNTRLHVAWPRRRAFLLIGFAFVLFALGASAQTATTIPIATNSTWQLFRGTSEASAPVDAWRFLSFNDSAWQSAPAPFHVGTNNLGGDDNLTNGTILSDMTGGAYTCVFLRQKFVVNNASNVTALQARLALDDGIIIWINGVEVRRLFLPAGTLYYTNGASSSREVASALLTLGGAHTNLIEGTNVIAVQAFNYTNWCPTGCTPINDDFRFDIEVTMTAIVPPVVTNTTPASGSSATNMTQFVVQFSQNVTNVRVTDLRLNGQPATGLSGTGPTSIYTFTFPVPTSGVAQLSWSTNQNIRNTAGAPFAGTNLWTVNHTFAPPQVVSANPPFTPGGPAQAVTNLTQITVHFNIPVNGLRSTDLLINNQAATNVTGSGTTWTFEFPQPTPGTVNISWDPLHGITDASGIRFQEASATWSYTFTDLTPPVMASISPAPGVTLASVSELQVTFSEAVTGIDAADLLINGTPSTSVFGSGAGPYIFQFPSPSAGTGGPTQVAFAWASGHNIRDTAATPNHFGGGNWTITLDPAAFGGDIIINEFLAANVITNTALDLDEDNELQDWIELYNRGTNTVRLLGWSLTDNRDQPRLWTFPDVTLAPNSYLLVYASAKDRKAVGGGARLHTNFKLGSDGEYLALFNADSPPTAISVFSQYPEQRNDYSYGLLSSNQWRYFQNPTPNAPNGTSTIVAVMPPPHANVSRGMFEQPFTFIASCSVTGATIRYTLDGTEPTLANGFTYSAPFPVTNTMILRMASFLTNTLPSRVTTHSYIFLEQVLRQPAAPQPGFPPNWGTWTASGNFPGGVIPADYEMDPEIVTNALYAPLMKQALTALPIISVVSSSNDMWGLAATGPNAGIYTHSGSEDVNLYRGPLWERPCSVEFFNAEGEDGFQINAGMQMQGNAARNPAKNPKHPIRVSFKGDYGATSLDYPVFPDSPRTKFDSLNFRADYNFSWLHPNQRPRGQKTRDTWMKATMRDMGGVASHNRYAHLYINGLYWGVYDITERPDGSFGESYLGGTADEYDAINEPIVNGNTAVDGNMVAYNQMLAIKVSGQTAAYQQLMQIVDIPQFIDYMLLHFYVGHEDWGHDKNFYALRHRSPTGTWKYIPWDGENVLGTDVNRNNVTVNSVPSGLHTNLVTSYEYRVAFGDRAHKHFFNGGAMTVSSNLARYMSIANKIDVPIIAESARWGDYRRDVHSFDTAPYELYTRNVQWLAELNRLTNTYIPQRGAIFINQLRTAGLYPNVTAPVFNQHGGRVAAGFSLTMSGATNTVYFTTNGADPRLFGSNTVASYAQVYTGPLTLNSTVTVKARALFGTNWSALVDATFTVGSLGVPIRITELMYNPVGGDPYEFIELQNVGATPLNIGQYYFSGVTFAFPVNFTIGAGQRIVLGNNTSTNAWKMRYPGVTPVGWYGGRLSDNGEKITLFDNNNSIVVSVDYGITGGWPGATNGYSLEITSANGDPDDPANWRTSSAQNGSPGAANAVPPVSAVVLNEVGAENLTAANHGGTFPDWVELYNSSANPTNIAGWSITDDGAARKFVFPANTIIPAGGYLVVWCDATTNTTPGLHTGFSLGRSGDNVFLYDQNTNRVDAITFGPQVGDYSVGRVAGTWTLTTPTTNAPNVAAALASASSLSINEWLANAAPGGSDWVELFNSSASAPAALNGMYVGTTNALYQLTALSFIPARGFLQLLADEGAGADHVDFKLAGAGGAIVLYDTTGAELQRVNYGVQAEGVSSGRFPDGTANIVAFPGSSSPGASNYINSYSGPLINEVLAKNSSTVSPFSNTPDFIELFNNSASPFNVGGMGLSDDSGKIKFVFAPGTTVAANSYLVVWCDSERADMTNAPVFNASFAMNGDSGAVYLLNTNGQAVQTLDYGFQVTDMPLGYDAGKWLLLSNATPGAVNAAAAALGSATNLLVNEWSANPSDGDDWFELFNNDTLPVNMAGIYLTDDPSLAGLSNSVVAPLSFIAGRGWVKFVADGNRGAGHDHVAFSLEKNGELIRIYNTNFSIIDTVSFGPAAAGSEGRLPDAGTNVVSFPLTPTPGSANYLPHGSIVVNEVLTHTDSPWEDAIELQNVGTNSVDISGWWISNSERTLTKFQVPAGTVLAPGEFKVFYENQFDPDNTGNSPSFTLNSAHGDSVYVSEANGSGALTGYRAQVSFGAAENPLQGGPVSFGRFRTSVGVDFTALTQRTFGVDNPSTLAQFRNGTGASNSYAKVGPVVISEIHYHPVNAVNGTNLVENADEEFIELQNITGGLVALFDVARPTNVWRLAGGVSFKFATNQTLAPGAYLLVVNFNPTNTAALNAFRAKYGNNGVIVGPFNGRLGNGGDVVELYRPDAPQTAPHPDAGYVPQILVDRVVYSDAAPWANADGNGASLQRIAGNLYGNDPANWKAEPATAGRTNTQSGATAPTIATQPADATATVGGSASFTVTVNGTAPFVYQWRHANTNLPGATNGTLNITNVQVTDAGDYRVFVTNSAGSILSDAAVLTVIARPQITQQPTNTTVIAGNTAQFAVSATGSSPLGYFWYRNGLEIVGANNAMLTIPAAQPANGGNYFVVISNAAGSATSQLATLSVIVPPAITADPGDATVLVNHSVSFSIAASGTAPLNYQWRRNGVNIPGANSPTLHISSAQPGHEGAYSCVVSNSGGFAISDEAQLTVSVAPVLGMPYWRTVGGPPVPVLEFFITGASNYSYVVDYSTNLVNWSNLYTVILTGTASTNVMDYSATNAPIRFYRARLE